jgi:hypothetical protein
MQTWRTSPETAVFHQNDAEKKSMIFNSFNRFFFVSVSALLQAGG